MPMVNYLFEQWEDCPEWLIHEDYNLTNFFGSRNVCYPGSGADGTPIEVFNRSHSAHCYFFIDQAYSRMTVMEALGPLPRGYELVSEQEYFTEDLGQECAGEFPEIAAQLFELPPNDDHLEREYLPPNFLDIGLHPFLDVQEEWHEFRLPADSESAARLLVYRRRPNYGEDHGASRFAVFLLGHGGTNCISLVLWTNVPESPAFCDLASRLHGSPSRRRCRFHGPGRSLVSGCGPVWIARVSRQLSSSPERSLALEWILQSE